MKKKQVGDHSSQKELSLEMKFADIGPWRPTPIDKTSPQLSNQAVPTLQPNELMMPVHIARSRKFVNFKQKEKIFAEGEPPPAPVETEPQLDAVYGLTLATESQQPNQNRTRPTLT